MADEVKNEDVITEEEKVNDTPTNKEKSFKDTLKETVDVISKNAVKSANILVEKVGKGLAAASAYVDKAKAESDANIEFEEKAETVAVGKSKIYIINNSANKFFEVRTIDAEDVKVDTEFTLSNGVKINVTNVDTNEYSFKLNGETESPLKLVKVSYSVCLSENSKLSLNEIQQQIADYKAGLFSKGKKAKAAELFAAFKADAEKSVVNEETLNALNHVLKSILPSAIEVVNKIAAEIR